MSDRQKKRGHWNLPFSFLFRISFIDAVHWLADAIHGVTNLELRLVPDRRGRFEPSAVKRRPKEYNRLNQPRDVLRKRLLSKKDAA